jgi:hypothetical protein
MLGLVGAGVVARGLGLIFSGKAELLSSQLGGLIIVSGYSFVITTLIALAVDRSVRLVGSSRLVDETIVRFYRELNARDIDAALARLHPEVAWPSGWGDGSLQGAEALRDHLTRYWSTMQPELTPLRSHRVQGGWIEVDVHQIVRDLDGTVLTDSTLVHAFRERAGLFDRMELR